MRNLTRLSKECPAGEMLMTWCITREYSTIHLTDKKTITLLKSTHATPGDVTRQQLNIIMNCW